MRIALFKDSKEFARICVSSANCESLNSLSPTVIPFISGSAFTKRVRPSATKRNARGDSGHPWGMPQCIVNGLLRRQLALIHRVGSESTFVNSSSHLEYPPGAEAQSLYRFMAGARLGHWTVE